MAIYSRMGCVAPKRHPGCHDHCPEYKSEKSKHDEQKAAEEKIKYIEHGLDSHFRKIAYRANKKRRQKG